MSVPLGTMIGIVESILITACVVVFFYCGAGCLVAQFKIPANRKPGVTYWQAWRWFTRSIFERNLFLDDMFTELGVSWVRFQLKCFFGMFLVGFVAIAIGAVTGQLH